MSTVTEETTELVAHDNCMPAPLVFDTDTAAKKV